MTDLEAAEDLRFIMAIGAALGGEKAKPYLEYLQATAYDPTTAETGKKLIAAADADRGQPEKAHA